MIIMNHLYPPVLWGGNIWGTPPSFRGRTGRIRLGGLHLREGHGGRGRVDSSLIESGTGSAGMTYEARAQCTVPLRARGTRFFPFTMFRVRMTFGEVPWCMRANIPPVML